MLAFIVAIIVLGLTLVLGSLAKQPEQRSLLER